MKNEKESSNLKFKLDYLIGDFLDKQIFSACSVGFFKIENSTTSRQIFNYGRVGQGYEKKLVGKDTFFDLASLTKPLVTSLVILFLANRGYISFDDKLNKFFDLVDSDKDQIKIKHLLSHTSGLPAHKPYFYELLEKPFEQRPYCVVEKILSEKLYFAPGQTCLYSDLGFILLGAIIERVTGENLDVFWEKKHTHSIEGK